MPKIKKYAYFVINDSDDLKAVQDSVDGFGGGGMLAQMDKVIIDYSLDKKRRINQLLDICNPGDIVYTPYFARLEKSIRGLYEVICRAEKQNVKIVCCDHPDLTFDSRTPIGQNNLSKLEFAANIDFDIRSENNKAHTAKRADAVKRNGYFIIEKGANKGEKCTYVGSRKGHDTTAAREASILAKQDAVIHFMENSKAVKYALRKYAEGWGVTQISEELGKLYEDSPEVYGTPKGCKPSKGTVSKWIRDANPILLA